MSEVNNIVEFERIATAIDANYLKMHLEILGLKQSEFAKIMGVSRQSVSELLKANSFKQSRKLALFYLLKECYNTRSLKQKIN